MRTSEIISEIQRLPIQKRIYVIEKTIHSIRKKEDTSQMKKSADVLFLDYQSNKELTAFTDLDLEDFYEAR
ncbi:hypothetical protein H8E88_05360 [candidate division KSB1 bacterium]|nr:hypothetical protein [candidate division KSB1 bacterium]